MTPALAASSAAVLAFSSPAQAALVVNPNGTLTVTGATAGGTANINFGGQVNGAPYAGLTSTLSLTFEGIIGGQYQFQYSVLNTSSAPVTNSRVSGFAFNTDPNVTTGSITGGYDNIVVSGSYPEGAGAVDVCFSNSGGSCSGPNGALFGGAAATGTLRLGFAVLPAQITISDFLVRYQSINGPGQNGGSGIGRPTPPVPEPGTWAMMLIGFGAVGFAMRRSRNVRAQMKGGLPQLA